MKYLFVLMLTAAACFQTSLAQDRREKLEAMKVAFLTQELNLTPQEAQQFWPVFNQFEDEMKKLRKQHRAENMNAEDDFDKMSDGDVSKLIDDQLSFQQQELDLRKRYVGEFKKVLPVKKVARLMRAEQKFKLKLLQEYKNRQGGGRDNRDDGNDGNPPPRDH